MQLVGVAGLRAHLFEHGGHRLGVERAELGGGHGQAVGPQLAEAAAHRQGAGAPLLERRVVEVGVGPAAQEAV